MSQTFGIPSANTTLKTILYQETNRHFLNCTNNELHTKLIEPPSKKEFIYAKQYN